MIRSKKRTTLFIKIAITNIMILILSLLTVGLISHNKAKNAMQNNLEITSLQILKQANKGFSEYLNRITQELYILDKNVDINYNFSFHKAIDLLSGKEISIDGNISIEPYGALIISKDNSI